MEENSSGDFSETIYTTIGELVEAVTEIALESGKSEEEGYRLASLTLEAILRRKYSSLPTIN